MNNDLLYIYLNFIFYVFVLILLTKFNKQSTISIFLLSIWSISAASSILYYPIFNSIIQINYLKLEPYIYIFVLSILFFIPILTFKNKCLKRIDGNISILRFVAYIITTLSILPFTENLIYTILHLGSNANQFGENYGENVQYLSSFSQVLYRWCTYFSIINSVLFFYFLTKKEESKFIKIGLLVSMLTPILGNLNGGSRFSFVTETLYIIFLYILFYNLLDLKLRKRIFFYLIAFGVFFGIIFMLITLLRFDSTDSTNYTLLGWMSLYSGESYLNFNDAMWNVSKHTNGDNCFFIFKHIFGDYPESIRDFHYLENIVHIRMNVYYTFIGDLFIDFGKYVTIIIIIACSFLMKRIVSFKNTLSIEKIILFSAYAKICLIGFTYYPYMNSPMTLVYTLIFIAILKITSLKKTT